MGQALVCRGRSRSTSVLTNLQSKRTTPGSTSRQACSYLHRHAIHLIARTQSSVVICCEQKSYFGLIKSIQWDFTCRSEAGTAYALKGVSCLKPASKEPTDGVVLSQPLGCMDVTSLYLSPLARTEAGQVRLTSRSSISWWHAQHAHGARFRS